MLFLYFEYWSYTIIWFCILCVRFTNSKQHMFILLANWATYIQIRTIASTGFGSFTLVRIRMLRGFQAQFEYVYMDTITFFIQIRILSMFHGYQGSTVRLTFLANWNTGSNSYSYKSGSNCLDPDTKHVSRISSIHRTIDIPGKLNTGSEPLPTHTDPDIFLLSGSGS